jgi:hypothetical protein
MPPEANMTGDAPHVDETDCIHPGAVVIRTTE